MSKPIFETGKTYLTRDGCRATILADDLYEDGSLLGIVLDSKGTKLPRTWSSDGRSYMFTGPLDLITGELDD